METVLRSNAGVLRMEDQWDDVETRARGGHSVVRTGVAEDASPILTRGERKPLVDLPFIFSLGLLEYQKC